METSWELELTLQEEEFICCGEPKQATWPPKVAPCMACGHEATHHHQDQPYAPCDRCPCKVLVREERFDLICVEIGCGHRLGEHGSYSCAADGCCCWAFVRAEISAAAPSAAIAA